MATLAFASLLAVLSQNQLNPASEIKSDERGLRFRAGTAVELYNSFVTGSERCIQVNGDVSRSYIGQAQDPNIIIEGVSFACAQTHDGDTDGTLETYLDTAPEVSQNGEQVSPVAINDEFFEATDFIGAFGAQWGIGHAIGRNGSNAKSKCFH